MPKAVKRRTDLKPSDPAVGLTCKYCRFNAVEWATRESRKMYSRVRVPGTVEEELDFWGIGGAPEGTLFCPKCATWAANPLGG